MFSWETRLITFIKQYYKRISCVLLFLLAFLMRIVVIYKQTDSLIWYVNVHPFISHIFASSYGNLFRYAWSIIDVLIPLGYFFISKKEIDAYLVALFLFNPALVLSSTFSGGIVTPILMCIMLSLFLIKNDKKALTVILWVLLAIVIVLINFWISNRTVLWREYIQEHFLSMLNILNNHQLWTVGCSVGILLCSKFKSELGKKGVASLCFVISTIIYANNMFNVMK